MNYSQCRITVKFYGLEMMLIIFRFDLMYVDLFKIQIYKKTSRAYFTHFTNNNDSLKSAITIYMRRFFPISFASTNPTSKALPPDIDFPNDTNSMHRTKLLYSHYILPETEKIVTINDEKFCVEIFCISHLLTLIAYAQCVAYIGFGVN